MKSHQEDATNTQRKTKNQVRPKSGAPSFRPKQGSQQSKNTIYIIYVQNFVRVGSLVVNVPEPRHQVSFSSLVALIFMPTYKYKSYKLGEGRIGSRDLPSPKHLCHFKVATTPAAILIQYVHKTITHSITLRQ